MVTFTVRDESLRIFIETIGQTWIEQSHLRANEAKVCVFTYVFLLNDIPLRSFLAHYAIPKRKCLAIERMATWISFFDSRLSRSTTKWRLNPRLGRKKLARLCRILRRRSTQIYSHINPRIQGSTTDRDGLDPKSLGDNIVKTNAQQ